MPPETPGPVTTQSFEGRQNPDRNDTDRNPRASIQAAVPLSNAIIHVPPNNEDFSTTHLSDGSRYQWSHKGNKLTATWHSPIHKSSKAGALLNISSRIKPTNNYCLARILEILRECIPPVVNATRSIKEGHLARILYEYRAQRCSLWFMNPPAAILSLLALSHNPCSAAVHEYVGWIDKLEHKFTTDYRSNPPLDDTADCLLAQLELVYLKFTTVDGVSGYALLQKALPRFLRLVAADTSLFMEHPNGNLVVSFSRTLGAPRYELERFVLYDTTAAFILGVPPLVEYGYDSGCNCVSHGFEWIHGIPFTLVEIISQINSWRAGSRVAPLDDWQALERRIMTWQPPPVMLDSKDSATGSVARLAVQESWRHVVLVYLYMGMCEVSSHDPRVQASIRQIVRLGDIVANLPIGTHMFTHCVIAGIGARLEKYRHRIRERLLSFRDTRVWLFRGPQFSRVLDHLWHGVGVGGAPVLWDDYVRSRCVVIPI
ncbi:unnamed protein product [Rhizoctonia solani]|uniref:Fungal zn(2)-cys(6) binuclear cluster domain protein n=1 Tax=Rhizoctonia solani TaxID=456999 RepID=A0A8H2XNE8_9AGAM|nr:unnamed protein product [Rhizoctonia solani]